MHLRRFARTCAIAGVVDGDATALGDASAHVGLPIGAADGVNLKGASLALPLSSGGAACDRAPSDSAGDPDTSIQNLAKLPLKPG